MDTFGLTRTSEVSWHCSSFLPSCPTLEKLIPLISDWNSILVIIDSIADSLPFIISWLPWLHPAHILVTIPGSCHFRCLARFTPLTWSKVEHPLVGGRTTLSAWIGTSLQRYHQFVPNPDYCFTSICDILAFTLPTATLQSLSPPPSSMPHQEVTGV